MKHLRVLRLMRTKITDATVQALGGLDQLESLDLFGTAVTPAALAGRSCICQSYGTFMREKPKFRRRSCPEAVRGKLTF